MAPSSLPHPLSHADTLTLPTPFAGNTAITASYANSFPRGHLDATKPTILFFHSFTTDTTLFAPQFDDADLTAQANLIAVDLIGHGRTRIGKAGVSRLAEDGLAGGEVGWNDEGVLCRDHWTYWDSAWMALGVLRELGVEKAFVAGTSQGGWVAVRCALLAPEVVLGLIPMGTSMDHESPLSISLGCWDGHAAAAGPIAICTSATPTPDFAPPDAYCDYLIDSGLGKDCDPAARQYWTKRVKENYKGDAGRRRMRGAAINLAERDGLYGRLGDIKCPVLWLHGDKDEVYSVKNAEEGLKHFGSEEKRLEVVEGGHHFLSGSSPDVVNPKIAEFASKHWRGGKTVPGRIGTPDVAERVASGI